MIDLSVVALIVFIVLVVGFVVTLKLMKKPEEKVEEFWPSVRTQYSGPDVIDPSTGKEVNKAEIEDVLTILNNQPVAVVEELPIVTITPATVLVPPEKKVAPAKKTATPKKQKQPAKRKVKK